MPRNSFLPGDRVVMLGRRGRVWRVDGIDSTIRVVFDDSDVPESVGPFDIEHDPAVGGLLAGRLDGCTCDAIAGAHKPPCPWAQNKRLSDVLGFDERERRAVAEVACRSCDAQPGEDCTSVFDRAQRMPHPHYSRWCDVVVERQVLPPEVT